MSFKGTEELLMNINLKHENSEVKEERFDMSSTAKA